MDPNGRSANLDGVPVTSSVSREQTHALPGPAPRPFGLPPTDYDKNPIACLSRLRDEYGDVFTFAENKVVLARPEWVHWALVRTNSETRVNPPKPPESAQRKRLIRDQLDTWMIARRTTQWHRLGRDIAEQTTPSIHRSLKRLLDHGTHSVIRLSHCEDAIFDAIVEVFINDMDSELRKIFVQAAGLLRPGGTSSIALPDWMSPLARRRIRVSDVWINALAAHVRARREARKLDDPPADMLDLLIDARDDGEPTFTDIEVAQTLSINLGNLYTVGGVGLAWLLAAHGAHDLRRPAGVDRVSWAKAITKETLRFYPSVSLTSRELVKDTTFGDVTVPAGSAVFLSPLLIHTDPRWWRDDPNRFDPARWLRENVHDKHAYLPYGAGPRICTGLHISNVVLGIAAELLADTAVTTRLNPPKRRWGSVTQPQRFRARIKHNT